MPEDMFREVSVTFDQQSSTQVVSGSSRTFVPNIKKLPQDIAVTRKGQMDVQACVCRTTQIRIPAAKGIKTARPGGE